MESTQVCGKCGWILMGFGDTQEGAKKDAETALIRHALMMHSQEPDRD